MLTLGTPCPSVRCEWLLRAPIYQNCGRNHAFPDMQSCIVLSQDSMTCTMWLTCPGCQMLPNLCTRCQAQDVTGVSLLQWRRLVGGQVWLKLQIHLIRQLNYMMAGLTYPAMAAKLREGASRWSSERCAKKKLMKNAQQQRNITQG